MTRRERAGSRSRSSACLSILIGLLVLHHTFQTVAVVGFIVGIFWVIAGVTQLVAGFEAPRGERAWLLLIGAIGTIVGIITLVYPGLSLVIIAVLMGIWLILFGILQLIVGLQIRKLRSTWPDPDGSRAHGSVRDRRAPARAAISPSAPAPSSAGSTALRRARSQTRASGEYPHLPQVGQGQPEGHRRTGDGPDRRRPPHPSGTPGLAGCGEDGRSGRPRR